MDLRIDLNEPKIREKVTSDRFGKLVSNEWKRLIDPYTPRDTGTMQDTAQIQPWQIIYRGAKTANGKYYSAYVYYGYDFNFQHKNPYSTYEWDKAAEKAGQKNKLYRTLNNALQSGRF
jgi:hypothetical protein